MLFVIKKEGAKMNIVKETRLKELMDAYPWLMDEVVKISDKFKMLNTPIGKMMLAKATLEDIAKKTGIDTDKIITKLLELIKTHG